MNAFYPGFERQRIWVNRASIRLVHGGESPVVLLLHRRPHTHRVWPREGLRSRLDSSTIRSKTGFGQTMGIYGKTYS